MRAPATLAAGMVMMVLVQMAPTALMTMITMVMSKLVLLMVMIGSWLLMPQAASSDQRIQWCQGQDF